MQGLPELEPLRTRIYIDGYNFYYGCLRGTPHKWLDLLPLFENHILPSALLCSRMVMAKYGNQLCCLHLQSSFLPPKLSNPLPGLLTLYPPKPVITRLCGSCMTVGSN